MHQIGREDRGWWHSEERQTFNLSTATICGTYYLYCVTVLCNYLISGVGHVRFGTFLRAVRVGKLHVEQVEDKTIKSRAQTVTEAPDSSNHSLDNTYRQTDINITLSGKSLINATFRWPIRMRIMVICQINKNVRHCVIYLSASSKTTIFGHSYIAGKTM